MAIFHFKPKIQIPQQQRTWNKWIKSIYTKILLWSLMRKLFQGSFSNKYDWWASVHNRNEHKTVTRPPVFEVRDLLMLEWCYGNRKYNSFNLLIPTPHLISSHLFSFSQMNFSNKSVLRNLHRHEVRHERVFHFLKIAVLLLIQAGEMQFKANEATFRGWSIRQLRKGSTNEWTSSLYIKNLANSERMLLFKNIAFKHLGFLILVQRGYPTRIFFLNIILFCCHQWGLVFYSIFFLAHFMCEGYGFLGIHFILCYLTEVSQFVLLMLHFSHVIIPSTDCNHCNAFLYTFYLFFFSLHELFSLNHE